jgi:hypothetical protein
LFLPLQSELWCVAIDNPTSCEIRTLIRYLHPKNLNAAEIHCELCTVYIQNIMNEGTVGQWCKRFKDEQTNIHNKEQSLQLSVLSDDLVQSVDQKNL